MSNDLCNDIINEILSWLPVDSLLRFKSVSKSWFSLIENPKFAELHLEHDHHHYHSLTAAAAQIHNPAANIMFLSSDLHYYCIKSIDKVIVSLSSSSSSSFLIEKQKMVVNSFDFTKQSSVTIVGSCNGLICLVAYDESDKNNIFYLWNPSTKEVKQLPTHGNGVTVDLDYYHYYHDRTGVIDQRVWYGFGYDHVTDDYKVLLVSAQLPNFFDDSSFSESEVKVYSLRTNTWRRIRGKPYNSEIVVYVKDNSTRIIPRTCTYVSGALHRVAPWKPGIVSFDIVDEVDREMRTPGGLHSGRDDWDLNLIVLRGCLCVSAYAEATQTTNEYMQVWMMKDYGMKESWTKLFSIINNGMIGINIKCLKPVYFHKNGEVVMVFRACYL